jgi:tRNA modification GTPase
VKTVNDTIAAISTPPGVSGLAVLRLSGPACADAARLCLGREKWKPRHLHTAAFRDPATGEILDPLTFHFLPGPRSPTGEDVLELFPHGNPLLLAALMRTLCAMPGIRPAESGEFTRRAFENGRMDLVQAEAVAELTQAQSRAALRNAQRLLRGELSGALRALRDALLDLSARLELDADFAEEEADPDYASWLPRVAAARKGLENLLRGFERSRDWSRIPKAVFYGAPNAGKSSLINALAAQDRLLVSEVAGTTRDFVEVPLRLGEGLVHLIDTAGLGRPVDGLDALAMERTRSQLAAADLKIYVADGASEAPEPSAQEPHLRVLTKSDLPEFRAREDCLAVSNVTGAGIPDLLRELESRLRPSEPESDEAVIATERQYHALQRAGERLSAAEANLAGRPAVEIVAFEVREACRELREMLGDIAPDDVLRRLFAGFCIGK